MGLAPDVFWSLTVREFWIKHRAFSRAEARQRGLFLELAAKVGQYKESDQTKMLFAANQLRQYPLKKWLLPKSQ